MQKTIILSFFLVLTKLLYAQDYQLVFDDYNAHYEYDWHRIAIYDSQDFETEFLEFAKNNNLLQDEIKSNRGDISYCLNTVDFNNDGLNDMIYSGDSGGEPRVVKFFLNENNKFKLVFTVYQAIVKVEWEENRISKIYTHDWGCCAECRLINSVYEVNYQATKPSFNMIFQSIEYISMRKPLEDFDVPVNFEVENEIYKLRFEPIIDDTSYFNVTFNDSRTGNTIGFLSKGTRGKAYGSSTDSTGRVWWYVVISPKYEVKDNVLYMGDLENPTHIVGWLSSRFVSKLN